MKQLSSSSSKERKREKGEGERRGKERGGKGEGKRTKRGEKKRNYEELTQLWRLTNYKICRVSQVGTQESQWYRCNWKSDMLKTQEKPKFHLQS